MRLITSLIIASVAGTTLVGGVKSYLTRTEKSSMEIMDALFKSDRPTAIRLIEQATFICIPELDRLKTRKARNLVPRVFVVSLEARQAGRRELSDQQKRDLVIKEIAPVLNHAPDSEVALLGKAVNQSKPEKAKTVRCVTDTVARLLAQNQAAKPKALLSDVELRGT
jgi:hypothetical protein